MTILKKARFERSRRTSMLRQESTPTTTLTSALAQIPTDHADGKDPESPLQDSMTETMTDIEIEMITDMDPSHRHTHTDQRRTHLCNHENNHGATKTLGMINRGTTQRAHRRGIPHSTTLIILTTIAILAMMTTTTITPPHPTPQPHHATTETPKS